MPHPDCQTCSWVTSAFISQVYFNKRYYLCCRSPQKCHWWCRARLLLGAVQRQDKKAVPTPGYHNSREAKPGSERSIPQTPRCSPWPGDTHRAAGKRPAGAGTAWLREAAPVRYVDEGARGMGRQSWIPVHPHRWGSASSHPGASRAVKSSSKARGTVCRGLCAG